MSVRLQDPLPGAPISDPFGWRGAIPSIGLPAQLHNGEDRPADYETPIHAAHDGIVIWTGWDRIGGGNGIQISTGQYSTLYFHMASPSPLRVGDPVRAGDVIGYVGSTGAATGPHLHFMLRLPGGDVNPRPYLDASLPERPLTMALTDHDVQRIAEAVGTQIRHHQREAGVSPDGTAGRTLFDLGEEAADGLTDKRAESIDHHLRHSFRERGFGWQNPGNGRTIWEILRAILRLSLIHI